MFASAVVDKPRLAFQSGGSQQDGAILGNGGAVFLCKFAATLIMKYKKRASGFKLNEDVYRNVLTDTLVELALEDVLCHGRMLVMLDALCDLTSNGELGDQNLALIYARDLLESRKASSA